MSITVDNIQPKRKQGRPRKAENEPPMKYNVKIYTPHVCGSCGSTVQKKKCVNCLLIRYKREAMESDRCRVCRTNLKREGFKSCTECSKRSKVRVACAVCNKNLSQSALCYHMAKVHRDLPAGYSSGSSESE